MFYFIESGHRLGVTETPFGVGEHNRLGHCHFSLSLSLYGIIIVREKKKKKKKSSKYAATYNKKSFFFTFCPLYDLVGSLCHGSS